jgi:hypothetical protein
MNSINPFQKPFQENPDDYGLKALFHLMEMLDLPETIFTRGDREFTWWPARTAQRVWADPLSQDEEGASARVHVETAFLRGLPHTPKVVRSPPVVPLLAAILLPQLSSPGGSTSGSVQTDCPKS